VAHLAICGPLSIRFALRDDIVAPMNRGLPLLDLIEEGNPGPMHSITRFDPDRSVARRTR